MTARDRAPGHAPAGTRENDISITLDLDGNGTAAIASGVGFLDHMLRHLAVFGLFDLHLQATGDLVVDPHHTVEDCALVLGEAFDRALGDRSGITRVGAARVPMDEALVEVVTDLSGRPFARFLGSWTGVDHVGGLPTSLFAHFLRSLATTARCNLHAQLLYGKDDHHQAEALFKALGLALGQACALDPRRRGQVPSTKGSL